MGGSLRQLTSRQLERLKSELAEVIIANFCYPAFLDYRLNTLRTRPVDRRKRQEVWAYVNSINFNALGNMDVASMDFRRFVERAFLRYIDTNRSLIATASARQVAGVRARVPQLALAVARGLADYLILNEASPFGQARLVESWGSSREREEELAWERIEKSTQVLQTTLVYLRATGIEQGASPDVSNLPTKMLSPASAAQPAATSNGASAAGYTPVMNHDALNHVSSNGAHHGTDELAQLPPLGEDESGARGQFRGPRRSPTVSRPVDRPPSVSHPVVPPSAPPGASAGATSRPIQPLPADQPAPTAQSAMASDAWQALLKQTEAEPPPAEAERAAASALPELPEPELLELPESFRAPRALDLPPDLAELYGDYLRDSRAASLELTASEQEPGAAAAQADSSSSPLPPSQTDAEVDALFTALTNRIAAHDQQEQAANPQQDAEPQEPARVESSESAPTTWNGAPRAADETASAALASAPLSGQRGEQPAPAAPARGLTDGDVMIFSQLQHQISTWVKMAAVSHQIDLAGRDAPELVKELRRTAALEEAELQVIESLVALCYRVTSTKQATMEDYKQAMMLYLLHHRSRLAL